MTLFDIINNLFSKKDSKITESFGFNEAVPVNFVLQRWITMESVQNSYLMNETTNKLLNSFNNDKELFYKFLYMLIDKSKTNRITYIKKSVKVDNEEDEKLYKLMSDIYGISIKEIKSYLTIFNIDVENYKKVIK